ncbi:MAG: 4-hydroxy-2-oxovalerate aldolase [Gaiellales bacterium]|nr:4-hydroxy-2-oxovalerate aldolase [Gaiellales bacterium]
MKDLKSAGIKERMLAGETLVGTFIQVAHPAAAEFVGGLGFDFMCLEAEHSAMGVETIQRLVSAVDCTPCETLVRIANNDWFLVAGALDAGASGVICPRVNSASEAEAFVRSALYPPVGDRGIGPGRVTAYGYNAGPDYRLRANERNLVAAQVETRQAMENLADIVALPGLDMVFVGPADLASSLALRGMDAPELREAVRSIFVTTQGAGKLCGIFAGNAAAAADWMKLGARLVLLASDLMFLADGAKAARGQLTKLAKKKSA